MHHRTDVAPPNDGYAPRVWEKPHEPNATGTAAAYRPPGSLLSGERRERVGADYDAWTPG
jgi:NADH:ubiquinone oxidoreductase subunit